MAQVALASADLPAPPSAHARRTNTSAGGPLIQWSSPRCVRGVRVFRGDS